MKNLFYTTLLFLLGFSSLFSQNKITNQKVLKFAKEVYGQHTEYLTTSHLDQYKIYLNQVEIFENFKNTIDAKNIKPISSVRLKNKYANIRYDNYYNFKAENFNALKYAFNFESKTDQYFLIDGTKTIIKIKAKK